MAKHQPKSFVGVTYRDYEILSKFVNDRANIVGRKRTGLTPKEQRAISKAVKQARYLGLLPYTAKIS